MLYFDLRAHEAFTSRPISAYLLPSGYFLCLQRPYVQLTVVISHSQGRRQSNKVVTWERGGYTKRNVMHDNRPPTTDY
jgi:hypothetical protein